MRLRHINATASADDEHDLTLPTWHRGFTGRPYDASLPLDDPALTRAARAPAGTEAAEAAAALRAARDQAV
jgi:hypothetical protein